MSGMARGDKGDQREKRDDEEKEGGLGPRDPSDLTARIAAMAARARIAARTLAPLGRDRKDAALHAIARGLRASRADLVLANARDVGGARARGTSAAMVDRLVLDSTRTDAVAESVE